jgi:hypothetical protein
MSPRDFLDDNTELDTLKPSLSQRLMRQELDEIHQKVEEMQAE